MYKMKFISERDFEKHVLETLYTYNESLSSISLEKFNSNIIDPIKLLFDKSVYDKSFEDTIELELQRQRDKSNTNAIGYFHQNMFKYINNCIVPERGWDVIYTDDKFKIYVEMKNKHNTMNSASSQKTYMKMQNQILQTPYDKCFLVEVIAPTSRNIVWGCSVDGQHLENQNIRRVSIDKFYEIVTGEQDAFYQICMQLPETITKLINSGILKTVERDTVIEELHKKSPDTLKALYLLAFERYEGFRELV